ncbi:pyridoxamine 5'-phosphate oxidase [Thalassobaculum fulvum]|uniref:Pyridoxamine 5'-phosphate oxidase n=1 Tax=Thalassobaculum fulvum TaxID=1633335 RepID=A0A918XQ55_9PROT|nr:pyridoxamine 5'-phosphate oxidase family protein [Thalassobaculum fulvum]GHD46567.1 pyridoxamine 5'-phosphate oxidase [Thalassobaculum fulvum]
MTPPPADLDALVAHVLGRLSAATTDPAAPWRTPMLATLSQTGAPTLRTVVLRAVSVPDRSLRINTHRHSDKAGQIARNTAVELCLWDPVAGQQLRIAGDAAVEASGPTADATWTALGAAGRALYRGGPPPGTPTPGPRPLDHPPIDPNGGDRDAFAIVTVAWRSWDWVWLGADAHRRARIRWPADGDYEAAWVVP